MVYITTFILTLFLTHIRVACALPRACGDFYSPESDGLSYGESDTQYTISSPVPMSQYKVTYDPSFDNQVGSMETVACSDGHHGLAARFALFRDVPTFPYIGGAFDVHWNSPNCGSCWKLTNTANNATITMTAIDKAGHGFNIAESAFEDLNGGEVGEGVLQVEAHRVPIQVCGL